MLFLNISLTLKFQKFIMLYRSLYLPWSITIWKLSFLNFRKFYTFVYTFQGFLGSSDGKKKKSTCIVGDLGSIPGLGRSPGEGNHYSLQYSCLENSIDRGAWLQSMGSQTAGHDWATFTLYISSIFQFCLQFIWLLGLLFMKSFKTWIMEL